MRIPGAGPLGETFFEARVRAMAAALFVKSPFGVFADQYRPACARQNML